MTLLLLGVSSSSKPLGGPTMTSSGVRYRSFSTCTGLHEDAWGWMGSLHVVAWVCMQVPHTWVCAWGCMHLQAAPQRQHRVVWRRSEQALGAGQTRLELVLEHCDKAIRYAAAARARRAAPRRSSLLARRSLSSAEATSLSWTCRRY